MERQVSAPGLVDNQRLTAFVTDLNDTARSAQVPYGLGLTTNAPTASG
jgi:hypothetical protein